MLHYISAYVERYVRNHLDTRGETFFYQGCYNANARIFLERAFKDVEDDKLRLLECEMQRGETIKLCPWKLASEQFQAKKLHIILISKAILNLKYTTKLDKNLHTFAVDEFPSGGPLADKNEDI